MGITIKEIAQKAGVSIATVSHVINKTRYVSPELVNIVKEVIKETGYDKKISDKATNYRVGKLSEVAFVVPNITSSFYAKLATTLVKKINDSGYNVSIHVTIDEIVREKIILSDLLNNKRIAGIIIVPASTNSRDYYKITSANIPLVFLERTFNDEEFDNISSMGEDGVFKATEHLIKRGHINICLLQNGRLDMGADERVQGYKKALERYQIQFKDKYVPYFSDDLRLMSNTLLELTQSDMITAFIAGGNKQTNTLLKLIIKMGVNCPKDISIIGFGDHEWHQLYKPPLTTLTQNTDELGNLAAQKIVKKIEGVDDMPRTLQVEMSFTVRESTQVIGRGPFGEKVVGMEKMSLSEDEIAELRNRNFSVAISFHSSGDQWTKLHEKAIRITLEMYGVKVIAVTDAHFDANLQITQLDSLIMQNPDAIISVPSDEIKTAEKFKEISSKTKLILINNMPKSLEMEDYSTWVSVNECENGQNAGEIINSYFRDRKEIGKVGLLTHGVPFFATQQRDFAAEQILSDSDFVEIVAKNDFLIIDNAYNACNSMVMEHPGIQAIYVTWDRPALQAIKALKDMDRDDIVISTTDLDIEIAGYLSKNETVIGLSSQRPYEQGIAVAIATAKALLGVRDYKSIGVSPYVVDRKNLPKAWNDIIKAPLPKSIANNLNQI